MSEALGCVSLTAENEKEWWELSRYKRTMPAGGYSDLRRAVDKEEGRYRGAGKSAKFGLIASRNRCALEDRKNVRSSGVEKSYLSGKLESHFVVFDVRTFHLTTGDLRRFDLDDAHFLEELNDFIKVGNVGIRQFR